MRPAVIASTVFLLATALARADDASLAPCGETKVKAVARACRDLLGTEAPFLRDGRADDRAARRTRTQGRLAADWASAEAAANDTRCSERTAAAADAGTRLTTALDAAVAELSGSTTCRRALVRLWAPLCRSAIAAERVAILGRSDAAAVRAAAVARVRARLARRWPTPSCRGLLSADAAAIAVLRLAAGAVGDATPRGVRVLAAEAARAIGAAIEPAEVATDPSYPPTLAHDVDSLTAENAMKWGSVLSRSRAAAASPCGG